MTETYSGGQRKADLVLLDEAILRQLGRGMSLKSLTHLLANVEGLVVSQAQVKSGLGRLVRRGRVLKEEGITPTVYLPV